MSRKPKFIGIHSSYYKFILRYSAKRSDNMVHVRVLCPENTIQNNVTIDSQSTLIFNLINTFRGKGFDVGQPAAVRNCQ